MKRNRSPESVRPGTTTRIRYDEDDVVEAQVEPCLISTTAVFRFFDLPREIRDLIYNYTWELTSEIERNSEGHPHRMRGQGTMESMKEIAMRYLQPMSTPHSSWDFASTAPPAWVLVSKQFLHEATEQLYHLSIIWGIIPAERSMIEFEFECRPRGGKIWLAEAQLASLTEEYLHMEEDIAQDAFSYTDTVFVESWPMEMNVLRKLESVFVGRKDRKTLCISFRIYRDRIANLAPLDFSAFDALGFNIEKLVFRILDLPPLTNEAATTLYSLFEPGMLRLGRLLVGEGIRMDFDEAFRDHERSSPYWRFEITEES